MRRVLLLVVGICLGGAVFVMLCVSASAQFAAMQTPAPTAVSFPCQVDGTPIRVLSLAIYDGAFGEDGSFEEQVGVAAVVIQNTGEKTVRAGELKLCVNGQEQNYRFSMLPPGGKLLVPEYRACRYVHGSVSACTGFAEEVEAYCGGITAQITSQDALQLTNNTPSAKSVTVYFKSYYAPEELYLGGIAFEASAAFLAPGQSVTQTPYHMTYGYTKIVYIEYE